VVIGIGVVDPDNSMDEMWVAIGAYPGFISGVIFSVLAGRRPIGEVSSWRAALLGGAAAVLVGLVPFALGEPTTAVPLWQVAGGFLALVVVASVLSAVVSVRVSRALQRRRLQPSEAVEIGRGVSSQG
jgi:hypothetical protein